MNDQLVIKDVISALRLFSKERDWDQFHNPKNLSMALSVEAAELLEHFQWLSEKQANELRSIEADSEKRKAIADEIADVILYSLRISDVMNIDLKHAIEEKMKKNAEKYPIEKAKGTAKKYSEL